MAQPDELLQSTTEAKWDQIRQATEQKIAELDARSQQFIETGVEYGAIGRTEASIGAPTERVKQLGDRLWENRDGTFSYERFDGTFATSRDLEGIAEIQRVDVLSAGDEGKSTGIVDTAKGVGEAAYDVAVTIPQKAATYAFGRTSLDEAVKFHNIRNQQEKGLRPDQLDLTEKDTQTYKSILESQRLGSPLTAEQQAFADSDKFATYQGFEKEVAGNKAKLDQLDKERPDWSRKRDDYLMKRAFMDIKEKEGVGSALGFMISNPGYLGKIGVESVPYMVALAAGGPVTGTAVVTTYALSLAADNSREFERINGREPNPEERVRINALSTAQALTERFTDRILLGKYTGVEQLLNAATKNTPKSLKWLTWAVNKSVGIAAEGASGASTEAAKQLAVEGEITDTNEILYQGVLEAGASPSGLASAKVLYGIKNTAQHRYIINRTQQDIKKQQQIVDNLNQQVVENAGPEFTEQERIDAENKLAKYEDSLNRIKAKNPESQYVPELEKRIQRLQAELELNRPITKYSKTTPDGGKSEIAKDANTELKAKLDAEQAKLDTLNTLLGALNDTSLISRLKKVPAEVKEYVSKEAREKRQQEKIYPKRPTEEEEELLPESVFTENVQLDPQGVGYDPAKAIEALNNWIEKGAPALQEDDPNRARNKAFRQRLINEVEMHLDNLEKKISRLPKRKEEERAQLQKQFTELYEQLDAALDVQGVDWRKNANINTEFDLNTPTPIEEASDEAKGSLGTSEPAKRFDLNEVHSTEERTPEQIELDERLNELLDAVDTPRLRRYYQIVMDAIRRGRGTDGTPESEQDTTRPSLPKTMQAVTEQFLGLSGQNIEGERKPGLIQLALGVLNNSKNTRAMNRAVRALELLVEKQEAKLVALNQATAAANDTNIPQLVERDNTVKGGYKITPYKGREEDRPTGAFIINPATNRKNPLQIETANQVAMGAMVLRKVENFATAAAEKNSAQRLNRLAAFAGVETAGTRKAKREAEAAQKPEVEDAGTIPTDAAPAAAPQSAATDPIVSAITNIVQAVRSGQMTQEQANIAIAALTASQSNTQPETTTPQVAETAPSEEQATPEVESDTPTFDRLPAHTPGQKSMTYAGIGSRDVPANILSQMTEVAKMLASMGYTLYSGGAKGSDKAFEAGAGQSKEIFYANDATDTTRNIAKEIHPAPGALKGIGLDLMARNTHQVFGSDLNSPVDFVLVYTADGAESTADRTRETGGSGQAIDMASRKGIPVINLANPNWRAKLDAVLNPPAEAKQAALVEAETVTEPDTEAAAQQPEAAAAETDVDTPVEETAPKNAPIESQAQFISRFSDAFYRDPETGKMTLMERFDIPEELLDEMADVLGVCK